ncbi:hypothetical protein NZD89_28615 (plasmid) [Alicyclobacillus fastidiosus]|uniref:Uncharacterized protein n=1 Tax=Alicyclobacillus fastidiosus TaxID=392011 RepID=A0ABY6ZPQ2_9BACL|nr:hypothetical protein [Alicyclobacillus fastidiosus]WAH44821.1 hypothetical protein NZD89_28615 [Alicyclobacillus fastidiosus]GMA65784.1 hypothetical protein GCM10025859_62240 [Alicyclobacillus fastidiosus]
MIEKPNGQAILDKWAMLTKRDSVSVDDITPNYFIDTNGNSKPLIPRDEFSEQLTDLLEITNIHHELISIIHSMTTDCAYTIEHVFEELKLIARELQDYICDLYSYAIIQRSEVNAQGSVREEQPIAKNKKDYRENNETIVDRN